MAALTLNLWLPYDGIYMGTRLYDLHFVALLEGRFDLPLRELRLEGHYAPDGTGYLYHGLGPLITRLPFALFVEFPTGWLTPISIWFWAMVGNICCHRAFLLALAASPVECEKTRDSARMVIAVVIWMSGPAWLLASNGAIFSEPVAMAYALGSGIVLLLARCAFAGADMAKALVPLAIFAGLTVHARPHLAVGYYAGVCMIAAFVVWRGSARVRIRAGAAMAILGLCGVLLLVSNMARFNAPGAMHGSFDGSEVQYGWVYLGGETADSDRAKGFSRYGQFNARRILPSAMVYTTMPPPIGPIKQLSEGMETAFHKWDPATSFVRLEDPQVGTLLLWPVIMLLMVLGLAQRSLWRMPQAAGMFAVGAGSALLLSYGTITLRYHVDLWLLFLLPALFGVAPMLRFFAGPKHRLKNLAQFGLAGALVFGVSMSMLAAGGARQNFIEEPGLWTREFCLKLIADKGYAEARAEQICAVNYEPTD
ncbi:MAG: hypothetical protein P8J20_04070 [Novosphingobium sp.]|nr:hypothetical protein [Novosphingobium sp.]